MLTGVPVDGPQIAPDSTAYQTTITDSTTGYTTQIAHITPTGTTTITLAGEPVGGIQFASNGTAYQTSRTGDPTTGYTTHVTNITSGTTTTLTGYTGSGVNRTRWHRLPSHHYRLHRLHHRHHADRRNHI